MGFLEFYHPVLIPSFYRCFPHVVNIAVQTALKDLKEGRTDPTNEMETSLSPDPEYDDILRNDPVRRCRELVSTCRSSDIRRADLLATIKAGNMDSAWGAGIELRLMQLLRDVETRWSSTFLMIDRAMELYPVSIS